MSYHESDLEKQAVYPSAPTYGAMHTTSGAATSDAATSDAATDGMATDGMSPSGVSPPPSPPLGAGLGDTPMDAADIASAGIDCAGAIASNARIIRDIEESKRVERAERASREHAERERIRIYKNEKRWCISISTLGLTVSIVMFALATWFLFLDRDAQKFCNTYTDVPCDVSSTITGASNGYATLTTQYNCTVGDSHVIVDDVTTCIATSCVPPPFDHATLRQYSDNTVRVSCSSSQAYGNAMSLMYSFGSSVMLFSIFMTRYACKEYVCKEYVCNKE
jgi:hypothetical protein